MTLTIEDGTGVLTADTYETRANFITYALNYFGAVITDDDTADAAMRRAFVYLNGLKWQGTKTYGRDQRGQLPRDDMGDVPNGEVPFEAKEAQCILAYYEYVTPNVLSPSFTGSSVVKREKVEGAVEVEYAVDASSVTVESARAYIASALELLRGLLLPGQIIGDNEYTPSAFVAY